MKENKFYCPIKESTYYKIPHMFTIESIHSYFIKYCNSDFSFLGETHDCWEFVYVFEGCATIVKNDQVITLKKGEAIFHSPMEFHSLHASDGAFGVMNILFSASNNSSYNISENIYKIDLMNHNLLFDIKRHIEKSYKTLEEYRICPSEFSDLELNIIALKLELFILELVQLSSQTQITESPSQSGEFSRISCILKNNLSKNLSVEEIASMTNLGVSNLKRICRKYTGMGPAKYFLHLKITHATAMLKNGMSISKLSDGLGFSSPNYFSSVYKRETGKKPIDIKSHSPNSTK